MKSKITLICVQPAIRYYAWQVEVMLDNFINLKIHENHNIHCVFAYNKNESDWEEKVNLIKKLKIKYIGLASFFFYQDTRTYPISYISSIRPNCLKQHFLENKELENSRIFYHDCDIVFTKPVDYSEFINDNIWYLSDTNSYISYDYIGPKGHGIYEKMCEIIGIDTDIPKRYNNH